jgi:hypothetical protein
MEHEEKQQQHHYEQKHTMYRTRAPAKRSVHWRQDRILEARPSPVTNLLGCAVVATRVRRDKKL